ncbi:MAG: flagellar protein FliS [Lachnospirales bacterium]
MIDRDGYTKRIANATPLQLVVITYEIAIEYLKESKLVVADYDVYFKNIRQAQKSLRQLMTSLDMDIEISGQLMNIYLYINRLILGVGVIYNETKVNEAIDLLTSLKEGFEGIKEANEEKMMENVDKVYAGLTYKNGKLEEFVDSDSSKGIKV